VIFMTSEDKSEQLSAFIDDALDDRSAGRLLNDLSADPTLNAKYRRYQAARMAMRAETVALPDLDFAKRVRQAIDLEPVAFAPRAAKQQFRERVTTFALAASMAALAILVVRSVNHYSPDHAGEILAGVNLSTPVTKASMEPDLRDYINMHNESAYLSGSQGLMSSVRLVSGGQRH